VPPWPHRGPGSRRPSIQCHLGRIADQDPGALRSGNRSADQDQAAVGIGRDDLDVLRGHAGIAHVAGHLLALEHLAGVLALAGRTVRTVRDRVTVRRAATTHVVTLDDALETLADRRARHIDLLAGDKVLDGDLGADIDHVVGRDAELGNLRLRLDGSGREMAAHRLRRVLHLGEANAELNGGVAILLLRALRHDLAVLHLENGDGNMFPGIVIDAGHSHLLCNHT